MKIKAPKAPAESPEEAARRQAEEARVAAAQATADRQAVTANQKLAAQRTRRVVRVFGSNPSPIQGGSIADQVSQTINPTTGGVMLSTSNY